MGDFSIRCAISGVPIPCNTPVLVFRLGKSEKNDGYHYLASMPVEGVMGSYGQADDIEDFYIDGFLYQHVLPNLWKAAGEIWMKAMFRKGVPSLIDEIERQREDYAKSVKTYEKYKGTEAYAAFLRLRMSDVPGSEWLRRIKDLVLFAPDFGETGEVMRFAKDLIMKGETLDKEGCEKLRDLIAGFMSTCITGTSMLNKDQTYPFEQYPDLKVDLLWHKAIVAEIMRIRKEDKRASSDADL